jgi:hypothetical protein
VPNMHYKLIEEGHVEKVILGKYFNLGTLGFLSHVFTIVINYSFNIRFYIFSLKWERNYV